MNDESSVTIASPGSMTVIAGNLPGVQEAYQEAVKQQIEASQPEPLPSMPELMRDKKPTFKYLSLTGMFNRTHKRELALKLTRQNRKRREIKMLVCSICRLAYMGKINRCQCSVIKPARKPANAN